MYFLGVATVSQYNRAVVFRLGRYARTLEPGLNFYIPVLESLRYVDMRTITSTLNALEAVTKDSVPIKISTVVWFRIIDAEKSVVRVDDVFRAIESLAPAVLRSVIGGYSLESVLHASTEISETLRNRIEETVGEWGVDVSRIEMTSVDIPEELHRAIAAEAEADRERKARIIKADAEFQAAGKLRDAAALIREYPEALELRRLEMVAQVGAEHNTTTVVLLPSAFMDAASAFANRFRGGPDAAH